jgi:hypothetical protein
LNEESRRLITAGSSSLDFVHPLAGYWTTNPAIPETAIAYEEQGLVELLARNGFKPDSIQAGRWCGRSEYVSYQDIVVLKKL